MGGWARTLAAGHVSQPPPPIYREERLTSQTQSAFQFTQDASSQFQMKIGITTTEAKKQSLRYIALLDRSILGPLDAKGLSSYPF